MIALVRSSVILANGHSSPLLTGRAEFLLTAIMLATNFSWILKWSVGKRHEFYVRPGSPNARDWRCLRRSSSVVPPQTPASPWSSAHRRQVLETGHVPHTRLACSI